MTTPQPKGAKRGFSFLSVGSAEGRRSAGENHVSARDYEAARQYLIGKGLPDPAGSGNSTDHRAASK